ncbi:MAG: hypothetical protein F6K40_02870 [Okeania sp. SIO3I5]|uniref:hypothetical protein n=1 Tax=Okeania sp. SIO3I5 TaxID=2607805 RepID=UPI0013B760C1|nr:hypothetical protein [Okeania sp. SIO3I5]NEQ35304.1 hypothetical protein [Okeania sp. SIO3I5]
MSHKFKSFLFFFLLLFSVSFWVNYYPLSGRLLAETSTQEKSSTQKIFDKLREFISKAKPPAKKKAGGSRTDNFCIITPWLYKLPNQQQQKPNFVEVFQEEPMFIWQGEIAEIFIQVPSENQQEIWAENINRKNQIIYQGKSLERGKIYELFFHKGDTTSLPFPFKIIDGDRREIIESELKVLSEKYPGISAEEMALLRANYFMEKGLFGDAYQELFSVAKPSAELKENLEEIKKAEFCPEKIVTQ